MGREGQSLSPGLCFPLFCRQSLHALRRTQFLWRNVVMERFRVNHEALQTPGHLRNPQTSSGLLLPSVSPAAVPGAVAPPHPGHVLLWVPPPIFPPRPKSVLA